MHPQRCLCLHSRQILMQQFKHRLSQHQILCYRCCHKHSFSVRKLVSCPHSLVNVSLTFSNYCWRYLRFKVIKHLKNVKKSKQTTKYVPLQLHCKKSMVSGLTGSLLQSGSRRVWQDIRHQNRDVIHLAPMHIRPSSQGRPMSKRGGMVRVTST